MLGIRPDRSDQLRVDPEARGDQEEPVLVPRLRFADVDRAVERARQGLGTDREGADLRAVRASAGPSLSKLAWASGQAVCPSAASGLIVNPGGRVTVADLSSEGELAKPRNCGALSSRFSPEAESVSVGGRAGVEDRVEDLEIAVGRRRVAALDRAWGVPGPGRSGRSSVVGQRPGAGRRVVGQRVDRDARRGGRADAGGVGEARAVGRVAGRAFREAFAVVARPAPGSPRTSGRRRPAASAG